VDFVTKVWAVVQCMHATCAAYPTRHVQFIVLIKISGNTTIANNGHF